MSEENNKNVPVENIPISFRFHVDEKKAPSFIEVFLDGELIGTIPWKLEERKDELESDT